MKFQMGIMCALSSIVLASCAGEGSVESKEFVGGGGESVDGQSDGPRAGDAKRALAGVVLSIPVIEEASKIHVKIQYADQILQQSFPMTVGAATELSLSDLPLGAAVISLELYDAQMGLVRKSEEKEHELVPGSNEVQIQLFSPAADLTISVIDEDPTPDISGWFTLENPGLFVGIGFQPPRQHVNLDSQTLEVSQKFDGYEISFQRRLDDEEIERIFSLLHEVFRRGQDPQECHSLSIPIPEDMGRYRIEAELEPYGAQVVVEPACFDQASPFRDLGSYMDTLGSRAAHPSPDLVCAQVVYPTIEATLVTESGELDPRGDISIHAEGSCENCVSEPIPTSESIPDSDGTSRMFHYDHGTFVLTASSPSLGERRTAPITTLRGACTADTVHVRFLPFQGRSIGWPEPIIEPLPSPMEPQIGQPDIPVSSGAETP